jgi:thiamine kinase-like enzyme
MFGSSSAIDLFPFIGAEHPFYAPIENLKNELLATPLYQEVSQRLAAGEETEVRISMKAHPKPNSRWALKGFSLSLQFTDRSGSKPFHASTFFCSAKKGLVESFEFPRDPYLTTLDTFFSAENSHNGEQESRKDVLRYYPGKRLTFRASNKAGALIGKFVGRSAVEETYNKLFKISHLVSRSRVPFSVPAVRGIDLENSVFFQEEKAGTPLAKLINRENFGELLFFAGLIHRDLHLMNVTDLPKLDFDKFLKNLVTSIEWISLCQPDARPFLTKVRDLLFEHLPHVDPSHHVFCHGDFSCLQILKSNDNYSVIDFDDCLLGERYMEIARLTAFLKYDLPLFRDHFIDPEQKGMQLLEEACAAYLKGYQERAHQVLNQKRLLWFRICFEIQYLVRLFKRDLFHPLAYERTIKIIRGLSKQFSEETGAEF